MAMEIQTTIKAPSWVSQDVLQDISHEIEFGYVIQDILRGGELRQMRLSIPYGACKTVEKHVPKHQETILPQLNYQFEGESGTARVILGARDNIKKTGIIEITKGAHATKAFVLGGETRRLIESTINASIRLQGTESVRRISTNLKRPVIENNLLRYSDIDGNVYYLWAPKIKSGRLSSVPTDSHKAILGLYKEVNGMMKYYQVINSFQETGKGAQNAYLHVVEGEPFDNFVFLKLLKEELIMDNEIGNIATAGSAISLNIETLKIIGINPRAYITTLENINIV